MHTCIHAGAGFTRTAGVTLSHVWSVKVLAPVRTGLRMVGLRPLTDAEQRKRTRLRQLVMSMAFRMCTLVVVVANMFFIALYTPYLDAQRELVRRLMDNPSRAPLVAHPPHSPPLCPPLVPNTFVHRFLPNHSPTHCPPVLAHPLAPPPRQTMSACCTPAHPYCQRRLCSHLHSRAYLLTYLPAYLLTHLPRSSVLPTSSLPSSTP